MKDDANIINEQYSKIIRQTINNPGLLQSYVDQFKLVEPECAKDIDIIIESASKYILSSIPQTMQLEAKEAEGLEDLDKDEEETMSIDYILDVAASYEIIKKIISAILGSGLLWGSARFEQEFERYWGPLLDEVETHKKIENFDIDEIF
jgi:hypothetical protein